jgi:hypothetical protein
MRQMKWRGISLVTVCGLGMLGCAYLIIRGWPY